LGAGVRGAWVMLIGAPPRSRPVEPDRGQLDDRLARRLGERRSGREIGRSVRDLRRLEALALEELEDRLDRRLRGLLRPVVPRQGVDYLVADRLVGVLQPVDRLLAQRGRKLSEQRVVLELPLQPVPRRWRSRHGTTAARKARNCRRYVIG